MTERQQKILEELERRQFISVEELSVMLFTSSSSIRRDLAQLEAQKLLRRTHGGAATLPLTGGMVPIFGVRMASNAAGKRKAAKKAAALLQDGQTILLDASTTASFLIPHIAAHRNMTVFTNNLSTAMQAIERGITTHCIGGKAVRGDASLGGPAAYAAIGEIYADLLFFSSQALAADGTISDATEEENYLRSRMLEAAQTRVFLCTGEKFDTRALFRLTNLREIDAAAFDEPFEAVEDLCRILK